MTKLISTSRLTMVAVILLFVFTGWFTTTSTDVTSEDETKIAGFQMTRSEQVNSKLKQASSSTLWNKCGFDEYFSYMKSEVPGFEKNVNAFEEYVKYFAQKEDSGTRNVVTIPVVVHVVWNTPVQNISLQQIQSQITVFNEDFRRLNADASNTPPPFQPLGADVEVEFKLAVRDPDGNPSLGVTRTQTPVTSFPVGNQIKISAGGGKDAWPSNHYMNVWTAPAINGNVLGFATFPGGPAAYDGIVVGYNYFGRVGVLSSPYNLGRTGTHEVGHWLSLYHIWGDQFCGNDFVADTPIQQSENFGCPSFPHRPNSCGQNNPHGDMFMNYMDYTNDNCMNIFTLGQKTRMLATLNGPRVSLLTSPALTPVSGVPIAMFDSDSSSILYGNSVNYYDDSRGIPTSWQWTFESGTPATSTLQNPTVSYSMPGRYDVQLIVSNSFGTDTLLAENYITVRGADMTPITLVSPPTFTAIEVSPTGTGTFHTFEWTSAGSDPLINYQWRIRRGGSPDTSNISYTSNNGGSSNDFTISNSELDSLASVFGAGVSDSVICIWSAAAFNGLDSISSNTFLVVLKRTKVGIATISEEIPDKFALWNNYPNPFNPVTKIKFDIPKFSFTTLTIYDMTGREVAQLVNEQLSPGSYEYTFDASGMTSGVYFYRIHTSGEETNYVQTKRMVLIK